MPAQRLAATLTSADVEGLLGVMVHPPALPEGRAAWDWVRQVQIAAALVLAYLDDGWEGSARRTALSALIYGPMDWTGGAAIVALADLAVRDPGAGAEVEGTFLDVLERRPSAGDWALEMPLLYSLARLPNLGERGSAVLKAHRQRW